MALFRRLIKPESGQQNVKLFLREPQGAGCANLSIRRAANGTSALPEASLAGAYCRSIRRMDFAAPHLRRTPKSVLRGQEHPLPFRPEMQSGRLHCPKARSLDAHSCFGRSLLLCQDHKKGHLHGSDQCCCRFFRLRSDFQACQRIGIGAGAPLSAGRTC